MDIIITPTRLSGAITPPPSKSQAHRLLIAACLAGGEERVSNVAESQDIAATKACMVALKGPGRGLPLLPCGESGSTLRFLIPVALALKGGGVFTGRGRLMERPQEPYFEIFREKGIFYEQKDGMLTVRGALTPGEYALRGDISSQFVTGLLYALSLLKGPSEIRLTTPLESAGYVDMTLDALARFGVEVRYDGERAFHVPGGQRYLPADCTVEPDWSQAGFWYAARGIGNAVETVGMNLHSAQGDRVLETWAAALSQPGEVVLDLSGSPDLAPPIAAWCALREGQVTRLVNASRLRIKESDRLSAIASELGKLGADVDEGADNLTIRGVSTLRGGEADSHNDHRIAMMAAIAATRADGPVTLRGAEAVRKSYPNFWEDYAALGGVFTVAE
ncbi:MAG TPA: 3-phosphoshikimate 1-carboxyvinyltransferase [Pseudoflavonifractor sp.]|nr:3-phosphoshikimate 1-carboxyvinyltransferase [Pseudoflavonifractor sp.]